MNLKRTVAAAVAMGAAAVFASQAWGLCAKTVEPPQCVTLATSGFAPEAEDGYEISNNCPHRVTVYLDSGPRDGSFNAQSMIGAYGVAAIDSGATIETRVRAGQAVKLYCCPDFNPCSGEPQAESSTSG